VLTNLEKIKNMSPEEIDSKEIYAVASGSHVQYSSCSGWDNCHYQLDYNLAGRPQAWSAAANQVG
jgi:hypothetical protein